MQGIANAQSLGYQTLGGATSGTWMAMPYNANVIWQNTSSNATYCTASAALAK